MTIELIAIEKVIESSFPVGFVSQLAEHESWRKELYRPVYYIHKWWARRLGSVFRSIIIASCIDKGQNVAEIFYTPVRFPETVIFDPFMGSGTTIGEAAKLGCRVIGRDINPLSQMMVKATLKDYSLKEVKEVFNQISETAGEKIRSLYIQELADGTKIRVLYYFWVKVVACPHCKQQIELFKSRIFAKHAIPAKNPAAKASCPRCCAINEVNYTDTKTQCALCDHQYNPQIGTVSKGRVVCPACPTSFSLIDILRQQTQPLEHKAYAKMVLYPNGNKDFLITDSLDEASYHVAKELLPTLWQYIPQTKIQPGYNTNQILNYNYNYWYQMFNARQLVSLAFLAQEISRIQEPGLRSLFVCLLSSTLEFNNMFCSFKGLGTGAVRHLFSHHILKPEIMPLEANVWGTEKSSGAFSTLFQTRILRALEYKNQPFELKVSKLKMAVEATKFFGISNPINKTVVDNYSTFEVGNGVYISCGDSAQTDIPAEAVDLIITDPPFFDNVHYSELADFFYVWTQPLIDKTNVNVSTTRVTQEVQSGNVNEFTRKLADVFLECHRVLKDEGILVFTYHHSRPEGWVAVYQALRQAGFYLTQAHPVKSEMAVAVPIKQAKQPINFDLIMVCKKEPQLSMPFVDNPTIRAACITETKNILEELIAANVKVATGDIKVILMGCALSKLARIDDLTTELKMLRQLEKELDLLAKDDTIWVNTKRKLINIVSQTKVSPAQLQFLNF